MRSVFVLVAALCVGGLNVLPHILRTHVLGESGEMYAPYTLRGSYDNVNVIAPRLHEVLEGHGTVSDSDLFEYKKAPAFWPMGSESYAYLLRPFTDKVADVVAITDFFFPMTYFLLLFCIALILTECSFWVSLFSATFVSVFIEVAILLPPPTLSSLGTIWRTVNPFTANPNAYFLTHRQSFIPGFFPLLSSFLFLFLTTKYNRLLYPVCGGFFFALTAYVYPYHFLYISAVCGILFLFALGVRDYGLIRRLFVWGAVGVMTAIPFIHNYIQITHLPQYQEIFARFGSIPGRSFNTDNWKRYITCVVVAGMIWKWGIVKEKRNESRVIISMLLAAIVVLNIQVLIGFSIHVDHWLNRDIVWAFTFAYIALLGWGVQYVRERWGSRAFTVLIVVAVALLASVVINNIRATSAVSAQTRLAFTLPVQDMTLFEWIRTHTMPEDVIMTPSLVRNTYLPVYTSANIFVPRAYNTIAPDKEILERLFITYRIFGVSENFLKRMLLSDSSVFPRDERVTYAPDTDEYYETQGSLYLFALKYFHKIPREELAENPRQMIPRSIAMQLVKEYKAFSCTSECFSKYRIDYLILGDREKALTDSSFDKNTRFMQVGKGSGWVVYKVVQ